MFKYAVVEIAGKQYQVTPTKTLITNFLGDRDKFSCEKVLLIADKENLNIGNPYLKEKLNFDVLSKQKTKLRVATYKAKANTRKAKGSKNIVSVIKLIS